MKTFMNPYMALMADYPASAFEADPAKSYKGSWRKLFGKPQESPLDLEIGTGNGFHFAHYVKAHPERSLLGFELKYKPLIQSIRRAITQGSSNAKVARADAGPLTEYFATEELNKVIIHHPDPWPKRRHTKNRLIQQAFLEELYGVLKPGGVVDFKTDHFEYFKWATSRFSKSKFTMTAYTEDLHQSLWANENFVTHFEKIFIEKFQPIFFCRLKKMN